MSRLIKVSFLTYTYPIWGKSIRKGGRCQRNYDTRFSGWQFWILYFNSSIKLFINFLENKEILWHILQELLINCEKEGVIYDVFFMDGPLKFDIFQYEHCEGGRGQKRPKQFRCLLWMAPMLLIIMLGLLQDGCVY